jgi:hypothetical protein
MTSLSIRVFISALGLAFILAAPAEAAKASKHRQKAATRAPVVVHPAYRGANLFPPGPVYYGSKYLGDDPDPFIRLQLLRDLGAPLGGNF